MTMDELLKSLGIEVAEDADDATKLTAIGDAFGKIKASKGVPSDDQKDKRLEIENADLKVQLKDINENLDKLKTASADNEDLKAQIQQAQDDAKAASEASDSKIAATEKEHAIEMALVTAGCKDVPAMLAHVDSEKLTYADRKLSGLDTDALKKDYGYLFAASKVGATGGAPVGGPEDKSFDDALAAELGVKGSSKE